MSNSLQEIQNRWDACGPERHRERLWRFLTKAGGKWYEACRDATHTAKSDHPDVHSTIERLLSRQDSESVLGYCPPDYDAQRQIKTLRAWLRVADLVGRHGAPPEHGIVERIAKEEGVSAALVRDLLSPEADVRRAITVTALLVESTGKGVPAAITLELLEHGSGEIFPAAAMALCRDREMVEAEGNVARWAKHRVGPHDVRWSLTPHDDRPLGHLAGPSLSGALAVGLALLLDPPDTLEDIAPSRVAIAAAVDADGHLTPISELWAKLAPQTVQLTNLHTLVVAEDQEGIPARYRRPNSDITLIPASEIDFALRVLIDHALPRRALRRYERQRCEYLKFRLPGTQTRTDIHFPILPLFRPIAPSPLHELDISQLEPANDTNGDPLLPAHFTPLGLSDFLAKLEEPDEPVRQLVLGGPGSGKSTLIQAIAWALVSSGHRRLPARVRLRDWEQWEAQHQQTHLADFLAARLRARIEQDAPTAEHWRRWLAQGEVVLLLDGLDELRNPHRFNGQLARLLNYQETPIILASRTTAFAAHRNHLDAFTMRWLGPINDERRRRYIQAYPARYGFDRPALDNRIRHDAALNGLARTPLLLAMLCFIADADNDTFLPAGRAPLYDRLIDLLLTRPGHATVRYPAEAPHLIDRKLILSDAALYLQLRAQFTFTEENLLTALSTALTQNGYGAGGERPWATALQREFLDNRGIVDNRGDVPGGQATFAFTHLTLHEFLTAYALSQRIQIGGCNSVVKFDSSLPTIRELLDKKRNCKGWSLTLSFLRELTESSG